MHPVRTVRTHALSTVPAPQIVGERPHCANRLLAASGATHRLGGCAQKPATDLFHALLGGTASHLVFASCILSPDRWLISTHDHIDTSAIYSPTPCVWHACILRATNRSPRPAPAPPPPQNQSSQRFNLRSTHAKHATAPAPSVAAYPLEEHALTSDVDTSTVIALPAWPDVQCPWRTYRRVARTLLLCLVITSILLFHMHTQCDLHMFSRSSSVPSKLTPSSTSEHPTKYTR